MAMAQSPSFTASANVVQQRNNNQRHQQRPSNRNNQPWQSASSTPYNSRPKQLQPRPYLGRCQICSVYGHSARRCPQLQSRTQAPPPSPASPFTPWQPRANLAVGSPYSSNNWLLDSGATHHITNDLNNLALHQPYTGCDDVLIGDGSPLTISHTGEGSQHGGSSSSRQNQ